ncbi:hypothetical protein [Anaerovorax odorimutans]|uniref:hypothetical protein n=1 Tax=Anaerovorax odorimutans TaxID=109327 RepID=UPI00041B564A|nr:hypothetical protein [Anaerovorax odorimutans]
METKTHWKKLYNPDYLGAYALTPGQDLIATIRFVKSEVVTGPDGKKEECMVMYFSEKDIKPMIMNSTNSKTISKLFKTPYIEEWAGRKVQIYIDHVKAFGEVVEALRIRPFLPKEEEYKCGECGALIIDSNGKRAHDIAQSTQRKYGKALCAECALKAFEAKKQEDVLNEDDQN